MATDLSSIETAAIAWHLRLANGDAATWEAFVAWLEADAGHAAAYDAVALADAALAELPAAAPALGVVTPIARQTSRWRPVRWTAIAASIAVAVIVPRGGSNRYEIVTRPGEPRIVALDSATRVALNGNTRMIFDRHDARFSRLESGEALFEVRHDPQRRFVVEVGDDRIEDLGTTFNVTRDGGEVRVAVASGSIVYNPAAEAVRLRAGQALVDSVGDTHVRVAIVDARAVGGWQRGQLRYDAEPLGRVAADLARAVGVPIGVTPELASRPFSGTLIVDRSGPAQLARLAPVLQVQARATRQGWTFERLEDVR